VVVASLGTSLLALIAPVRCSGCGQPDVALCVGCDRQLSAESVREISSLYLGGHRIKVMSAGVYAGARRQAMLDFKNGGQRRLARALIASVSQLEPATFQPLAGPVLVVPVPPSVRGGWNRGFSPSLLLAREVARGISNSRVAAIVVPRWSLQALLRSRFTARSRSQRLLRSSKDYRVKPGTKPVDVIVVDDVAVTGTTVRAVCQALVAAGFHCQLAVVAADVPRP